VIIKAFIDNVFDGHIIDPLLNQMKHNNIQLPKEFAYDRAGKEKQKINEMKIITPSLPK
jgi:IS5 family transposase